MYMGFGTYDIPLCLVSFRGWNLLPPKQWKVLCVAHIQVPEAFKRAAVYKLKTKTLTPTTKIRNTNNHIWYLHIYKNQISQYSLCLYKSQDYPFFLSSVIFVTDGVFIHSTVVNLWLCVRFKTTSFCKRVAFAFSVVGLFFPFEALMWKNYITLNATL